jgi:hypothetical protein
MAFKQHVATSVPVTETPENNSLQGVQAEFVPELSV